jgi:Mrp family chromosome partitioning ATPase
MPVSSAPLPVAPPDKLKDPGKQAKSGRSPKKGKGDVEGVQLVREQCRQLCLSLFLREHAPIRSLGFTSSIAGEGKSFLAMTTATVLAEDSSKPVRLIECNWEHPSLHKHFGLAAVPGLAEWLRGECDGKTMCHQVTRNLTVIPAGNAKGDAAKLLQLVRQHGLLHMLAGSNELLVVELPSIVSCAYGALAASLVESLMIVVRAGVTSDLIIADTCTQLKDLPVHGLILNQVASRIPAWIRQIL